jgi:hypothetical protein
VPLGLAHGHDLKSVLNGAKEILYLAPFFLAPALLQTRSDVRRFVVALLVGTGVAALYDIANRVTHIGYYPYSASSIQVQLTTGVVSRAYGLVTAPPFYLVAAIFALSLLVSIPMRRSRHRLLLLYTGLVTTLLLIQLLRGLFVGLVVGVVVLAFLLGGKARLQLVRYGVIVSCLILLASAALSIGGQSGLSSMGQRFASIVLPNASTTTAQATRQQRLNFIFGTYDEVSADGSPFLGLGFGYPANDPLVDPSGAPAFDHVLIFHSFVGWLIRYCGLLGLALYLLLLAAYFQGGMAILRLELPPFERAVIVASLASQAALVATSLAENYVLQYTFTVPLCALLFAVPMVVAARSARLPVRSAVRPPIAYRASADTVAPAFAQQRRAMSK